jgi:hypothetical protein
VPSIARDTFNVSDSKMEMYYQFGKAADDREYVLSEAGYLPRKRSTSSTNRGYCLGYLNAGTPGYSRIVTAGM